MRITSLLFTALVLLGGCANHIRPGEDAVNTIERALAAPKLPKEMWTLDELYIEISRQAPEFAGLTVDAQGRPVVHLVRTKQSWRPQAMGASLRRASSSIQTVMGQDFGPDLKQARAEAATYSFYDLAKFKQLTAPLVDAAEDIVSIDIDESTNKLTFGVLSEATFKSHRRAFVEAGVPADALAFRVDRIPQTLAASQGADVPMQAALALPGLRETHRPTVAGIETNGPSGPCTLGFNALYYYNASATAGFVTPSHCTRYPFRSDPTGQTKFYQPRGYLGVESLDRGAWICGSLQRCRYSDAAFVFYSNADGRPRIIVGQKPNPISGTVNQGSAKFNLRTAKYITVRRSGAARAGQMLQRTGRTTGTLTYRHLGVCVDREAESPFLEDLILYCQNELAGPSRTGDSGAPVFSEAAGVLYGMVWGYDANRNVTVYSPYSGISRDLGKLDASMLALVP